MQSVFCRVARGSGNGTMEEVQVQPTAKNTKAKVWIYAIALLCLVLGAVVTGTVFALRQKSDKSVHSPLPKSGSILSPTNSSQESLSEEAIEDETAFEFNIVPNPDEESAERDHEDTPDREKSENENSTDTGKKSITSSVKPFAQNIVSLFSGPEIYEAHCGYCDSEMDRVYLPCEKMSIETYEKLLNRGWNITSKYLYRNLNTCCHTYKLRIRASEYKRSKSTKQAWNKYKKLGNVEIRLERASFSEESYQLYKRYQQERHGDSTTEEGFKRHLVDNFLPSEGDYGMFHRKHYIDGKLVILHVVTILPHCSDSDYNVYDPDPEYTNFSLGKMAIIHELEQCSKRITPAFQVFGDYIENHEKLAYKSMYSPAEILDNTTNEWVSCSKGQEPGVKPVLTLEEGVKYKLNSNRAPTKSEIKKLDVIASLVGAEVMEELYFKLPTK